MVIYKGKLYRIEISLCCSTDACLTAYDNSTPTAVQEMDADTKKVVVFFFIGLITFLYATNVIWTLKLESLGKTKHFITKRHRESTLFLNCGFFYNEDAHCAL